MAASSDGGDALGAALGVALGIALGIVLGAAVCAAAKAGATEQNAANSAMRKPRELLMGGLFDARRASTAGAGP